MSNLIPGLVGGRALENEPLVSNAIARPSTFNADSGLTTPADFVDLSNAAQSIVATASPVDTLPSSMLANPSQPSSQTVTFSVAYPGGGSVTTTMSVADFEAALSSNDPNALGGESSSDGSSYSVRDILREAIGLDNASASSTKTSDASVDTTCAVSTGTPSSSSDAATAITLLRANVSESDVDPSQIRGDSRTSLNPFSKTANIALASIAGIQNGVSFSISFNPQPIDTAPTGLNIKV